MDRKQKPALIEFPISVRAGELTASIAKGTVEHSGYFKDGFTARWNTPNDVNKRNALRAQLIKKYNLG